jgi:hypothetical protein
MVGFALFLRALCINLFSLNIRFCQGATFFLWTDFALVFEAGF